MKKILIIAVALLALQVTAQEQQRERSNKQGKSLKMMDLSAEDAAALWICLEDASVEELPLYNFQIIGGWG